MALKVNDKVKVIAKTHARSGREGYVTGTGRGRDRYLVNFGQGVVEDMLERDLEKVEDKGKWDHKHGLAGKAADFTSASGVTAGAASLAEKKLTERIAELFGKTSDARADRLRGLPSHVAALNNELAPPSGAAERRAYDGDLATYRSVEQGAVTKLMAEAEAAGIDFPPIAVLFPQLGRVVILSRKNGTVAHEEQYFGNFATARPMYALDANALGDYYKNEVGAYANHAAHSPAGGRWVCTLFERGLADGY
jgi:hypothetical protein